MPSFDPATTALILIDLQNGIVAGDTEPRPSSEVVARARDLAARFREVRAPVVLVHVGWPDPATLPSLNADSPHLPANGTPPAFYSFVDGLREEGDIAVFKHHWGAFTGTDLDLQLRRRGVKTVVIGGISTNMGVESTARSAWELSYDVVIAEDICASRSADMHAFAIERIFPLFARVVQAEAVAFDIG